MHESWLYRNQLSEFASSFEARARRQICREDSLAKAEWMFFVGFFVIRKLIENRKVTDACRRMSVSIEQANINRYGVVSDFSRHDLEKDIDTVTWSVKKIDVAQLSDKIIHAWWTVVLINEEREHVGYIFTTDRDKDTSLWKVSTSTIVLVFYTFAKSEINALTKKRDAQGRLTYWEAE